MATVQATHMFTEERDGHTVVVLPGARFDTTSATVKAQPKMFEPVKRGRPRKGDGKD